MKRATSAITILIVAAIGALAVLPAIASAGSRLVWAREAKASQQIVSARPDGSQLRKLTHPKKHNFDIDAQISPDGSQVVLERDVGQKTSQVVIVGADGQNERVLDFGCADPCAVDISPTWLPAADRLAFTRVVGPFDLANDSAHSAVLYTGRLDGSDVQRLSEPGIDGVFEDYYARYSSDGTYIVFTRARNDPFNSAAFRINVDGSEVRRLTPWGIDADLADLSPATSGQTKDLVVFETYGHGPPEGKSSNVATVPSTCASVSDCRKQIRYLSDHGDGPAASFNPAWSPNGRRIAYTRFVGPDDEHECCVGDIWTMRPDGSHRRAVSKSPRFEYRPDWGTAP